MGKDVGFHISSRLNGFGRAKRQGRAALIFYIILFSTNSMWSIFNASYLKEVHKILSIYKKGI